MTPPLLVLAQGPLELLGCLAGALEGGGDRDRDGNRPAAGGVVHLDGRPVALDPDAEDLVSQQRLRGFLHGAVRAQGQDHVDKAVPVQRVHRVLLVRAGLTSSVGYGDRAVLRVGGGRQPAFPPSGARAAAEA
jgi:hypothetical protein